jgi:class 3 adenylate cyclase
MFKAGSNEPSPDDSYMCMAGLPVEKATHAVDAVSAALAICTFIKEEKQNRQVNGLPFFDIRIGLHSGPVVAGCPSPQVNTSLDTYKGQYILYKDRF